MSPQRYTADRDEAVAATTAQPLPDRFELFDEDAGCSFDLPLNPIRTQFRAIIRFSLSKDGRGIELPRATVSGSSREDLKRLPLSHEQREEIATEKAPISSWNPPIARPRAPRPAKGAAAAPAAAGRGERPAVRARGMAEATTTPP